MLGDKRNSVRGVQDLDTMDVSSESIFDLEGAVQQGEMDFDQSALKFMAIICRMD